MKPTIALQPAALGLFLAFLDFPISARSQVTTLPVSFLGPTNATLNASINPDGIPTGAYFRWGTNLAYGNVTAVQPAGSGTAAISISVQITGLTAAATNYHCQAVTTNATATNYGADFAFGTPVFPFFMEHPGLTPNGNGGYNFGISFQGTINGRYTMYGSTDLTHWAPVSLPFKLLSTNPVPLSAATNGDPRFFYQLRSP